LPGISTLSEKNGDRNKPGANGMLMSLFNEAISATCLIEIPLLGRKYTWTNNQTPPLLERLDWFFSSVNWSAAFPNTFATSLVRDTSDHSPCVISISTTQPRSNVFIFANVWIEHRDFKEEVEKAWLTMVNASDKARKLTAKIKILREARKDWSGKNPHLQLQ